MSQQGRPKTYRELLTNVGRHAEASAVRISLSLRGGQLRLEVEDDGRGFDPDAVADGTGLASVRRRCRALGAALDLRSGPGRGSLARVERKMTSTRQGRREARARRIGG